jgi:DNA (cytosine-5)-methyltransferase 1
MRYLDVCSGISAPTMAWKPLGWEAACYAEIEAAPRAILAHHYPDVPLVGDFTTIKGDEYGPVDLLVGGTPCQSFSVAGLRGGLGDDRGNLALEYLRLADRARPRWLVWENVPGVLSSGRGRDFGAILGGMGELGYGFAYRVLDAQHFGVPQRRRRVFAVGYLGDWRRAAAVLFERHSLSGHPAPRREAGEGSAGRSAFGISSDCFDRSGEGAGGTPGERPGLGIVEEASPALRAKRPNAVGYGGGNRSGAITAAACLTARGHKCDFEVETFITHSLRGEGFDASEDGTGRGTPLVPVHCQEVADPITAVFYKHGGASGGKDSQPRNHIAIASAVRRLTPRECERPQGFPDDFTLVPYRGRMMADGPRYKMLGNSMAVPVVRWIGERIASVERLASSQNAA